MTTHEISLCTRVAWHDSCSNGATRRRRNGRAPFERLSDVRLADGPAAMKKAAETLDQIDRLERRLRDAERGAWTVTAAVVCTPCQRVLVASTSGPHPDLAQGLRARIQELRRESAEDERRSA